jgi:hypothetical protein
MVSSEQPYIFFHGTLQGTSGDLDAIFVARMDWGGSRPTAQRFGPLLSQQLTLSQNNVVGATNDVFCDRIGTGDVNSLGHFATTISGSSDSTTVPLSAAPGVFLVKPELDFDPGWITQVVRFGDPAPDGSQYGGIFGDVALHDDDSVSFVAYTSGGTTNNVGADRRKERARRKPRAAAGRPTQNLIYVPQGKPRQASILLRSGDLLPQSNGTIRTIGLIDVSQDGYFVAQVGAAPPGAHRLARHGTALVNGRIGAHSASYRLLGASPKLSLSRGGIRDVARGEVIMGPRVARRNFTGYVLHEDSHNHKVTTGRRRGNHLLSFSGKAHDLGRPVGSAGVPVLTDTGLSYHTDTLCDGSSALSVSDGVSTRVILKSGDTVDGKVLTDIHQGYHPAQVDDAGRLVFMAEFYQVTPSDPFNEDDPLNQDPDNIITSIVVGIPS